MSRVLRQTKEIMPKTYLEFKNRNYKIFLLNERNAGNGLEFIRVGQERWDRRIPRSGQLSKSIIIFRTLNFCSSPPFDTFYFVHEMAHFHHIVIAHHRNEEIKKSYARVVAGRGKFKGMYTSKNYLEYFAETSATYLMSGELVPRPNGFPKGARQLKAYSPEAYRMCESFWENEKTNFKPGRKLAPRVDDILIVSAPPVFKASPQSSKMRKEIEQLIEWGDHYKMVSMAGPSIYKRESFDAYSRAHGKIIAFRRKFPDTNIENLRKKVDQSIRLVQ
jgi:hypothetical protein